MYNTRSSNSTRTVPVFNIKDQYCCITDISSNAISYGSQRTLFLYKI